MTLDFSPERPLRLTMWDWSWISHRVPGGAFENWQDVLAEARSRGFDTIRFDPLPDLVARGNQSVHVRVATSTEAVPWIDVPAEQRIDPVAEAVAFGEAAAAEGLHLILSSWGLGRGRRGDAVEFGAYPHFARLEDDTTDFAAYLDGWGAVLEAYRSAGLFDHVAYVDLNNEIDLVVAAASSRVPPIEDLGDVWAWTELHGGAFREMTETGLRWLHENFPELPATVSCCGPIETVGRWYPRNADVLEWHAWYSEPDRPAWGERVAALFGDRVIPGPQDFRTPERRRSLDATYRQAHAAAGPVLRRQQDRYLATIKSFADSRGLPAMLGEGYATPWYSDEVELSWDWIREVSTAAVRTVQRLGFEGYTTSNFSEPTFPLWQDVHWHRDLLRDG